MTTNDVPKSLNWVKARSECSGEQLFRILRLVVESDTKEANARARQRVLRFSTALATPTTLHVGCEYSGAGIVETEAVTFEIQNDGSIEVKHHSREAITVKFRVKPLIDQQGECKFEFNGKPLEPWQVSKRALEDLFFKHGLSATPAGE